MRDSWSLKSPLGLEELGCKEEAECEEESDPEAGDDPLGGGEMN